MTGKETLIGTPDPEDDRTPEERYEDHETTIRRDLAVEKRLNEEWHAAINSGMTAAEQARFTHEQGDLGQHEPGAGQ